MHRRLLPLLFAGLTLIVGATSGAATNEVKPRVDTGTLNGAHYTIAVPARWNHRVLLIAHGYRDAKAPLVADLFPDQLATKTFLDEGWIVAKTSYRRNGLIIADALTDVDDLRAHIAKTYGAPERVLLEGESMGGLIVTLAAEREPSLYAGAVAIGAALAIQEPASTLAPSGRPKIPLLYLTNQSELDGPAAYVAAARTATDIRPVLFRISRDGHVNVNQGERLVALRALNSWLDSGPNALPSPSAGATYFDATVVPTPRPSLVTPTADRHGFTARITEVSAIYGNVFIDAQPADFAAAGIAPGTWFTIEAHGKIYRTFYGKNFDSVQRGEWVVFANADGFFWLSRNWENAAGSAGLKLGDTVALRRLNP